MGMLEGALRVMVPWEWNVFGHTFSFNVFVPALLPLGLVFTGAALWPFIEQWVTGDKREHHLLVRPRNAPTRTAFLSAMVTLYGLLWIAGGNDVIATQFHLNLNDITYVMRGAVFIVPVLAFMIAKRWCISLQRHDNEMLLHGYESGVIMRSPDGAYSEKHLPLSLDRQYTLTARERDQIYTAEDGVDANGVASPAARQELVRSKLSHGWFQDNVQKPTAAELEEAHHHAAHEAAEQAGMLGHQADGHQYDDFEREVTGDEDLTHKH
jgi:ubiquinol-cytochrome c reductase cytochrome b subunit